MTIELYCGNPLCKMPLTSRTVYYSSFYREAYHDSICAREADEAHRETSPKEYTPSTQIISLERAAKLLSQKLKR